jgi:hypothetical protein
MVADHDSRQTARWLRAGLILVALALAACGHAGSGDDTATAQFDIQQAPSDALCVQLTVTGASRAVSRSFNLSAGQSTTSLTASGLPIGAVVVTGNAYGVLCGQINPSTTVNWIVTPLDVTITVAGPTVVALVLARNGQATISFDFQDDQRTVSTLAGSSSAEGTADGTGAAARFSQPWGTALDGSGNLYVADYSNSTIRKIVISTGAVTTLAGTAGQGGEVDGTGAAARFFGPAGLACDGTSLYVANACTIRKVVLATAAVTTIAGQAATCGTLDGTGGAARFQAPSALALDSSGNLYIGDANAVRQIALATNAVTTIAGAAATSGYLDGAPLSARFNSIRGLAFDGGALWIADSNNMVIRKLTLGAAAAVSTVAGSTAPSEADGVGTSAQLYSPFGLAPDGHGNLIVADFNGNTIRKLVEATGVVVTIAGSTTSGATDGVGAAARFNSPAGPVVDAAGAVYVTDLNNNTIRKL